MPSRWTATLKRTGEQASAGEPSLESRVFYDEIERAHHNDPGGERSGGTRYRKGRGGEGGGGWRRVVGKSARGLGPVTRRNNLAKSHFGKHLRELGKKKTSEKNCASRQTREVNER